MAIGESREFNEIFEHLHERIEEGHHRERGRRFEANMTRRAPVG
jgi:hypothetical protein